MVLIVWCGVVWCAAFTTQQYQQHPNFVALPLLGQAIVPVCPALLSCCFCCVLLLFPFTRQLFACSRVQRAGVQSARHLLRRGVFASNHRLDRRGQHHYVERPRHAGPQPLGVAAQCTYHCRWYVLVFLGVVSVLFVCGVVCLRVCCVVVLLLLLCCYSCVVSF